MSREVHVRFCERPEVKFLRPTHPYVTIASGFVYLAAILDAWSRRVVGYAISRSIDATARCWCTQGRYQRPQSAKGLRASFRPWVAICLRRLSRRLAKAWSHRLHGPTRQSLRQRQGRELHEDTQGRSRVSDGIRNLRGRYSRPSPLHRRGLQHPQTPLRARLSEPRAIRGSTRPATCQNRRLKLSTIKGALQVSPSGGLRFISSNVIISGHRNSPTRSNRSSVTSAETL